jgi:hypothetical protein
MTGKHYLPFFFFFFPSIYLPFLFFFSSTPLGEWIPSDEDLAAGRQPG